MSHSGNNNPDPQQPARPLGEVDPTLNDDRVHVERTVGHLDPPPVTHTTERTTVPLAPEPVWGSERVAVEAPVRHDDGTERAAHTSARTSVLRVPSFSIIAPILGWILAWGAIVIATTILFRADVPTGFGLGIATGQGNNGFWAGLWLLVVNAGAFLLGGYAAARIARAHGTLHGLLVWVVAMLATAADTVFETIRSGAVGVIRLIPGVPYWAGTDLRGRGDTMIVFALFAGAALVGALIGGLLGQTANRVERTDDAVLIKN